MVLVGMLSGKALSLAPAHAQQPRQVKAGDAQKWEYCLVGRPIGEQLGSTGKYIYLVLICYMQGVGCRKERIEVEVEDKTSHTSFYKAKEEALSKAFARLGDERWEVVGLQQQDLDLDIGTYNQAWKQPWLFKRLKQ
jgi:hypothetical protein